MVMANKPKKCKSTIRGHRKLQAAALQYDELAAIYDHAPIMMILLDDERRVKQVNQATIKFVDHPQNDILEIRVGEAFNCVHALEKSSGCGFGDQCQQCMVRSTILNALKTEKPQYRVPTPWMLHQGDRVLELHFFLSTIPLEVTGERRVLVCLEDITELKRVETELQRSEERYVLAQKAANIGSWDWNIPTNDLYWSEQIEPMFGFRSGEFGATYEAFLNCVHVDDRRFVEDSVTRCIEEQKAYDIEHRIVWPDGQVHWVSETGAVFRDETGQPIRMLGIVQDITLRKQNEEQINYLHDLLVCIKDIAQIISQESGLQKLLQKSIDLLLKTRNYIDITFSIIDDKRQVIIPLAHSGEHPLETWEVTLEGEAPECIKTVLRTRSQLVIYSTEEYCTGCGYCQHGKDHQSILIPMMVEKSLVGIMMVCLKTQHYFDEREIYLLTEIAQDLAFARAKIMADEALRRVRDQLEVRVRERTADLVKANEALQAEISERLHYQNKLRSLASELSLAEERERRRIATELHDRIVQTLAVTKIKLSAFRELGSSARLLDPLKEVLELINQTIQDTRTLTFELSPPILYELGLVPVVEWLAEKYEKQYGIPLKVKGDDLPDALEADVQIVLFQTLRGLFNNIVKHAQAKNVDVNITRFDSRIQITVEDDGVGFDTSNIHVSMESTSGFGLFNIRERLDHVGGLFEIRSKKDVGTRVVLSAPLKQIESKSE